MTCTAPEVKNFNDNFVRIQYARAKLLQVKKGHSQKFALPLLYISLSNARALQHGKSWKDFFASFRASYFWGNRRTNILFNLLAKYMDFTCQR